VVNVEYRRQTMEMQTALKISERLPESGTVTKGIRPYALCHRGRRRGLLVPRNLQQPNFVLNIQFTSKVTRTPHCPHLATLRAPQSPQRSSSAQRAPSRTCLAPRLRICSRTPWQRHFCTCCPSQHAPKRPTLPVKAIMLVKSKQITHALLYMIAIIC
jgi:hypothetical protein